MKHRKSGAESAPKHATIYVKEGSAALTVGPQKSVERVCRVRMPGAERMTAYKNDEWDGYYSVMSAGGTFPVGLVQRLRRRLKRKGYTVQTLGRVRYRPKVDKLSTRSLYGRKLRKDQMGCLRVLIENRIARIESPTGSGKTTIIAAAAKHYWTVHGWRVLVITLGKGLMRQNAKEFRDFYGDDIKVGEFGDNTKVLAPIVSATSASLQRCVPTLKKVRIGNRTLNTVQPADPKVLKLLKYEVIILDECHSAAAETWFRFAKLSEAVKRDAVSATAKDRRHPDRELRLEGVCGPLRHAVKYKELRDKKISKRIKVVYAARGKEGVLDTPLSLPGEHLSPAELQARGRARYEAVYNKTFLSESHIRDVVAVVKYMVRQGRKVFIPTRRYTQYERMKEAMRLAGIRYDAMSGQTPTKIRSVIKRKMMKGKFDVLIGNRVVDTGENIPIIDAVVFGEMVSSEFNFLQRIGRANRRYEGGSKDLWVAIFNDRKSNVIQKHVALTEDSCAHAGYEVKHVEWNRKDVAGCLPFRKWNKAMAE